MNLTFSTTTATNEPIVILTMPWDPVKQGVNRHDRRAKEAKARRKVDNRRRRR